MNTSRGLRGVGTLALLVALWGLATPGRVLPAGGDVTLRGSLGGAYLPMGEWKESFGATGHYRSDGLGRTTEIAVTYEFSGGVRLVLSGGLVTTSVTRTDYMFFTDSWGMVLDSTGWYSRWDFKGYPVGLSLEMYPWGGEGPVAACFGWGFSYYFSEVRTRMYLMPPDYAITGGSGEPTRGRGCGFSVYASVEAQVGHGLAVISRLRAQVADGMVLSQDKGSAPIPLRDLGILEPDPAVQFSGLDLSVGLAWSPSACWRHQ